MILVSPSVFAQDSGNATPGYTLIAPAFSTETYLIDLEGRVVHQWKSEHTPGMAAYLLEDGHLMRAGAVGFMGNGTFRAGGAGGVVEEFDWDGNLLWKYRRDSDQHLLHHDFERLPNGNVLIICWDRKTRDEAIAAGRDPEIVDDAGLWPDSVIEVKPTPPEGGEIVWEWHVWDHLIQDRDSSLPNYGAIAEHPRRINLNPPDWVAAMTDEQREELESLGYLGGNDAADEPDENADDEEAGGFDFEPQSDWNHVNGVAYNADLDQIALSSLAFSELWILDHSTTTDEAKGSTGGRWGHGGDLLYRCGNPTAHGSTSGPQIFFSQHNIHWITGGLPGAGHMVLYNNGRNRPAGDYSTADEVVLPETVPGVYATDESGQFLPPEQVWTYGHSGDGAFYSPMISGAQRLASGNTLICSGAEGHVLEVTPAGEVVWDFTVPSVGGPNGGPGGFQDMIIGMLDRDHDGAVSFDEIDNAPPFPGRGGRGARGGRGGPSPDFMKQMFKNLDTDGDEKVSREEMKNMRIPIPGRGGRGGPGGRGGRGGPPGFGAGGIPGNIVFRAERYAPDYPGFAGRTLEPGAPIGGSAKEADAN